MLPATMIMLLESLTVRGMVNIIGMRARSEWSKTSKNQQQISIFDKLMGGG